MGQVCFTVISSNRACPTVFIALRGGGGVGRTPPPPMVPPGAEGTAKHSSITTGMEEKFASNSGRGIWYLVSG